MAATRGPRPRPGVLDIAPYVPGTSALPGADAVIKLSSNETPFGPSPRAIAAYREAAAALRRPGQHPVRPAARQPDPCGPQGGAAGPHPDGLRARPGGAEVAARPPAAAAAGQPRGQCYLDARDAH